MMNLHYLNNFESLKDRQDNGEELDEEQLTKLSRMDEVVKELEEKLDVNLDTSSDEEEEEEEDHDKVPLSKHSKSFMSWQKVWPPPLM